MSPETFWNNLGHVWWGHPLLIGLPLFMLMGCVLMSFMGRAASTVESAVDNLPTVDRRKHQPRRDVYIPLELGPVTIDLQRSMDSTLHTAIGGTSGLGKSSAVLRLFALPIGILTIALDNTRPISQYIKTLPDGEEWSNESRRGLNLLAGEARLVSEALIEGWVARTQGDTGKWRRIARDRLWTALDQLDAAGIERNVPDLARALWEKTGDAEIDRACRDWAGRMMLFIRTMGPSLGTDIDMVQAMRDRKKLLLRVNPYMDPMDAPMLGGMLLVHARRVAQVANIPFILIIEEAGQLKDFQDEIVPLAQAARDRGVPVIILTQNLALLPHEVVNNISVWASFAQEDLKEMRFVAHKLRLDPNHLLREAFPGAGETQGQGWCYVRAPGVSTRLVHVELPDSEPARRLPAPAPSRPRSGSGAGSPTPRSGPGVSQWEVVGRRALDGWRPWTPILGDGFTGEPGYQADEVAPSWVGTDVAIVRMYAGCRRTGVAAVLWSPSRGVWIDVRGCLEWQGGFTHPTTARGAPRPRSTMGGIDVTPYIEFYRRARGSPEPSLDHLCDNPACCDPDHLETCSNRDNTGRNTPRRLAFEAAGWRKLDDPGFRGCKPLKWGRWINRAVVDQAVA